MRKKLYEFTYEKKDGSKKDYSVFMVAIDSDSVFGLDMGMMTEDERAKLIDIQNTYESQIDPFMKYYKRFLRSKLSENKEKE